MVKVHRTHIPLEEYFAIDEGGGKHEYLDGVVYAMAGGSPLHAALAAEVVTRLRAQVRGRGCTAFGADMRVKIEATGLHTYPDATVFCGPPRADPKNAATFTNPVVIIEVLSPSTEEYDRDEKFEHYARIESLRAYVLVWQDERKIEIRSREGANWTSRTFGDGERAALDAVGASLDVRELYDLAQIPS